MVNMVNSIFPAHSGGSMGVAPSTLIIKSFSHCLFELKDSD